MLSAHFEERLLLRWRLTGLTALTANFFLSQLAMGMVATFGVVYVYQLGTTWTQGLLFILGFYGLQRIVALMVAMPMGYLLQQRGHRRVMILSLFFLAGKLFFLVLGQGHLPAIIGAALFGGVYLGGYFVGFDGLFLTDGHGRHLGREYGWLIMMQRIGGMIAPVLGGLLITYLGFSSMFLASLLLVVVSCWPLWVMERHRHRDKVFSFRLVRTFVRTYPTVSLEIFLHSMVESILTFFWPLYLLMVMQGSYSALGGLLSVVAVVSSIGVYVVGRLYDARPLRKFYPYASMLTALMYGLRFGVLGIPLTVGITDMVGRFISPFWWMKLRRFEFEFGERHDRIVYSVVQEMLLSVGMLVGLALGVGLLVITANWVWIGIIGGVGVLMSSWVMETHEMLTDQANSVTLSNIEARLDTQPR